MSNYSLLNDGFKYQNLLNQTTSGNLTTFQLSTGAVQGYVLQSADQYGNGAWVDIGTLGVSSIQGTANQIYANGLLTPQIGDVVLTLPQSIATTSSPTFGGLTLTGLNGVLKASTGVISGSATTSDLPEGSNLYYTQARFDSAFAAKSTTDLKEGTNLYFTNARARSALSGTNGISYSNSTGIMQFDSAYSPTFAGEFLNGTLDMKGNYIYLKAGDPSNAIRYDASLDGCLLISFGSTGFNINGFTRVLVDNSGVQLPYQTASTYAYIDSTNHIVSRSAANFTSDVRSQLSANAPSTYNSTTGVIGTSYTGNLTLSGSSLDTVASPTFSNATFSSISASQYVKTNVSKQLTTVASIPASDISGLSATAPITFSGGAFGISYTSNLKNTAGSLDTCQNIQTTSTPTFFTAQFTNLSTNQLLYCDGSQLLASCALQGTVNQCTVSSPGPFITISLPQDIATTSTPSWANVFVNGSANSADSYLEIDNSTNGKYNYQIAKKFRTGGNTAFEILKQDVIYGQDSKNNLSTGMTYYTYCNSSTSGAYSASTIWEGTSGASTAQVFGMIGDQFYLPRLTASRLTYLDSNKYIQSATTGSSLLFSAGSLDVIQDVRTSASPQFTGLNISGATASTYSYFDGSKNLVSRSSANFNSDVRGLFSGTSPISYNSSTGAFSLSASGTTDSGTYSPTCTTPNVSTEISAVSCNRASYTVVGGIVTIQYMVTITVGTSGWIAGLTDPRVDITMPTSYNKTLSGTDFSTDIIGNGVVANFGLTSLGVDNIYPGSSSTIRFRLFCNYAASSGDSVRVRCFASYVYP